MEASDKSVPHLNWLESNSRSAAGEVCQVYTSRDPMQGKSARRACKAVCLPAPLHIARTSVHACTGMVLQPAPVAAIPVYCHVGGFTCGCDCQVPAAPASTPTNSQTRPHSCQCPSKGAEQES